MNDIFFTIKPFLLPVIITALSIIATGICGALAIKLIRRQIKLHNSITLVGLKSQKIHYLAFALSNAFFMIYLSFQMMDASSPETVFFAEHFSMVRWQTNWMLSFLILMLAGTGFLFVVLLNSKCAVVDKGVHTPLKYLDWYNVHGYIIDEKKCVVVLSSDKDTFRVLSGTCPPLKVAKNDIEKLKFILSKNKNKFSGFASRPADVFFDFESMMPDAARTENTEQ